MVAFTSSLNRFRLPSKNNFVESGELTELKEVENVIKWVVIKIACE
jgi:hypothetical protein